MFIVFSALPRATERDLMFMNEFDIEKVVMLTERRLPDIAPYARFLKQWANIINENSDGWPYWRVGTRAANRLMECLDRVHRTEYAVGRDEPLPTEKELRAALTPIRRAATKHGLPAPVLR